MMRIATACQGHVRRSLTTCVLSRSMSVNQIQWPQQKTLAFVATPAEGENIFFSQSAHESMFDTSANVGLRKAIFGHNVPGTSGPMSITDT